MSKPGREAARSPPMHPQAPSLLGLRPPIAEDYNILRSIAMQHSQPQRIRAADTDHRGVSGVQRRVAEVRVITNGHIAG